MQATKLSMGMPITIEILDNCHSGERSDTRIDSGQSQNDAIQAVFSYFQQIDNRFSTYKKDSEISKFNRHEIGEKNLSSEMKEVFKLSEKTKQQTQEFFNIQKNDGTIDPSGLVKGWAIWQASLLLKKKGFENFYIDAGGDVQVAGLKNKKKWRVGIKNPFQQQEIVKVVNLSTEGIATSGTYIRGQHVYNPFDRNAPLTDIVSLTVIGPNVYEADRFATAVFAMQKKGIAFIEKQKNLEGYMIDKKGIATFTSGFEKYTVSSW